ncbi:MAG: DNA replication and repair protein RecF [Actinobacteria bacterium]|uniref:DNA replication and repair protein RecF n=1 Tax=freshwater metagenome TaxID=449393 RepID=A0A6J6XSB8_9ZZZZ|nr:DNA replication and repair protein RecF [Actinomycetota bacterium]MSW76601.1 DNA replication and repair protein RecF [Actinomycetota bacterium]MSX54490.1 DNA replication and repair protein RecF [Actinomycetota bacterium]MSX91847.1 DNA replication and repair protein RecF [Actinomycetota bacterium]MSZ82048.1 DNA replication and repair protein RecF [Actinomycetota bacterium]
MIVTRLELVDFRNYHAASFDFHHGITAIVGLNGQGKTNLAEALAYLASLDSFRGAPTEALIRVGAQTAVVRATVLHPDGREVLVELELSRHGRNRVQVNKQKLGRSRELLGVMRVTVFSPDDLALVKGGPNERRRFMDDTLVSLALKYDALRLELDRIVKQRNVLLKQANGRLSDETEVTLDVWDAKLAEVGDQFGHARAVLIARLTPMVAEAYEQLADRPSVVELRYEPQWRQRGLVHALAESRRDDVRRGVSTIGPHRDDVELFIGGLPARTHASQGEQRTFALALRLAAHRMVADKAGSSPVLVLDDVLSELDPRRSAALLHHLPPGQVVLTTAGVLPDAARPDAIVRIAEGAVVST